MITIITLNPLMCRRAIGEGAKEVLVVGHGDGSAYVRV